MNASDWSNLIQGVASVYLLWQQNQIFKRQNDIFASQAGTKMPEGTRLSRVKIYWPLVAMSVLVVINFVTLGYISYDRHQPVQNVSTTQAADGNPPAQTGPTNFVLSIPGGNIFVPDQAKKLTGIALNVSIRNSGAPSTANDWQLWIVPGHNVTPVLAQLTRIPKSLSLGGPINSAVITDDQSLIDKTHQKPVGAGEVVDGVLLFYTSLSKSTVQGDSTMLRLSAEDISGKVFTAEQRMSDWLKR
jgi:hypothetical protein